MTATDPTTTFVVTTDGSCATSDQVQELPCPPAADPSSAAGAGQPVDKASAALAVATLKALFDRFALLDRSVRDQLLAATVPGERLPAVLPGTSDVVGWVTRTKPTKTKPTLRVTDPAAFLAWVAEHRPDEVVTPPPPPPPPPLVRSSFTAAVLEQGGVVDTATGEFTVPDGLGWVTPEPAKSNLRVVLEDGGAEAIEAAWAAGQVVLGELPGGES
jgi:hypothetical protein